MAPTMNITMVPISMGTSNMLNRRTIPVMGSTAERKMLSSGEVGRSMFFAKTASASYSLWVSSGSYMMPVL